jgi:hypothetical protein
MSLEHRSAVVVDASVVHDDGSWVVYLEERGPCETRRRRIAAYPSEHAARTASMWFVRSACASRDDAFDEGV